MECRADEHVGISKELSFEQPKSCRSLRSRRQRIRDPERQPPSDNEQDFQGYPFDQGFPRMDTLLPAGILEAPTPLSMPTKSVEGRQQASGSPPRGRLISLEGSRTPSLPILCRGRDVGPSHRHHAEGPHAMRYSVRVNSGARRARTADLLLAKTILRYRESENLP